MVATNRQSTLPIVPLLLLAIVAGALIASGIAGVAEQVRTRPEHSTAKHGDVVADIHRCLQQNGPHQVWRSTSWRTPNHYFLTCQLDDGTWGLSIVEKARKGWLERTTFQVKDGTLQQLIEYVSAKAKLVSGTLP